MEQSIFPLHFADIILDDITVLQNQSLGFGSFGDVFKAVQIKNNEKKVFAAKRIQINAFPIYRTEMMHKMLCNEICLMQDLSHKNIVRLFEVKIDQTNGDVYLIMELCEGQDLKPLVGKLPIEKIKLYFHQIVEAMVYANKKKIIHCDLKPANILISKNNIAKITDFGLARKVDNPDRKTRIGVAGTPLYKSPEILENKEVTSKTDVWSAGILLYELIFGRLPWGTDFQDESDYRRTMERDSLHFPKDKKIQKPMADLISRMLTKNPDNRISFEEILEHEAMRSDDDKQRKGSYQKDHQDENKFEEEDTKKNLSKQAGQPYAKKREEEPSRRNEKKNSKENLEKIEENKKESDDKSSDDDENKYYIKNKKNSSKEHSKKSTPPKYLEYLSNKAEFFKNLADEVRVAKSELDLPSDFSKRMIKLFRKYEAIICDQMKRILRGELDVHDKISKHIELRSFKSYYALQIKTSILHFNKILEDEYKSRSKKFNSAILTPSLLETPKFVKVFDSILRMFTMTFVPNIFEKKISKEEFGIQTLRTVVKLIQLNSWENITEFMDFDEDGKDPFLELENSIERKTWDDLARKIHRFIKKIWSLET